MIIYDELDELLYTIDNMLDKYEDGIETPLNNPEIVQQIMDLLK